MHVLEPNDSVQLVCGDCAPQPDPRYATLDPQCFVGREVKRAFPVLRTAADNLPEAEHMWCRVVRVNPDGTLQTRLTNTPYCPVGYRYRAWVRVALQEIEDVHPALADL
jgi:hypothetical protein